MTHFIANYSKHILNCDHIFIFYCLLIVASIFFNEVCKNDNKACGFYKKMEKPLIIPWFL